MCVTVRGTRAPVACYSGGTTLERMRISGSRCPDHGAAELRSGQSDTAVMDCDDKKCAV